MWPDAILLWIRQRNKCASDFVQIFERVWWRPWQWLDKRSEKKAWAVHRCSNGMSKLTKTEKGKTGSERSQSHAHHFLWHQWDHSQIIFPGRSNSQFHILTQLKWPPLLSGGQSSWLQIQRPGFDSRHYQKKNVVGLEQGALSLVSTNWGATW
jgi:hypothetical protein